MKKSKLCETVKNIEFMEDQFEADFGEEIALIDEVDEDEEDLEDDLIFNPTGVGQVEAKNSLIGYIKNWKDSRYLVEVALEANGRLPEKAQADCDAGFDIYTPEDIIIRPGQIKKIPLGFKMKFAAQSYAKIEPKSGLAVQGLEVLGGVIDSGYRGEVCVVITNLNWETQAIEIKAGEKIAQIVMHPYTNSYKISRVDIIKNDTKRGIGGFGSTGKC